MGLLGGLLGPSNRLPPGMAVMMPLAWAGCCWAWGFWMLRLPLRAWRNSGGLLEAGMVGREKEKVGSRGLERGSKNARRAKVCAQRRGSCSRVLLCCSAVEVGGQQRGGAARFCSLPLHFSAVRVGGAPCGAGRERGTIQSSMGQSPAESRAGQQPTEAGTERRVGAWLRGSRGHLASRAGSWPPIVGHLDRQPESLSPRRRRWWLGKGTRKCEETHGHSTAARELIFIVHSIPPSLGSTCKFSSWGRRGGHPFRGSETAPPRLLGVVVREGIKVTNPEWGFRPCWWWRCVEISRRQAGV